MRSIQISFLLSLIPLVFFGQSGSSNFTFCNISNSPLITAQGGSAVASGISDVFQPASNPAFADSSIDNNIQFSYLNYLTNINQTSLGYAKVIDSIGIVSGYFRYIDYGAFQETNEVGEELGEFRSSEYEMGVNISRDYKGNLFCGATIKNLFSSFYQNFAYGVAADVGAYYQSNNGLRIGATIDDLGLRLIDFNNQGSSLMRPSINFGISKKFAKAPLTFGIQYNNLETWDLASNDIDQSDNIMVDQLTGETKRRTVTFDNFARHLSLSAIISPSEKFAIVGGFNFRRRLELAAAQRPALVGFSFGLQAKVKRFTIQYGVASYQLNGTINHLALATNLNEWYKKRTK